MENFVTFPFDPNATQTGIRSGKRWKREFAACQSISAGGTVIFRSIFLKTLFFVYSNAFFEASLFSRCADNLLFTDAKHTDAVFHR